SPALSILGNGPGSFRGRKLGVLVCDGVDAGLFVALGRALAAEGAWREVVAPQVWGVTASDGKHIPAQQQLEGGPSVLYDAVVLLLSPGGVAPLLERPAARTFVTDAFVHAKFIGYTAAARPLLVEAGIAGKLDAGCIELSGPDDTADFIAACRVLRHWSR
ncbi:MAG TPA: catalase HPII, partial [Enhygromyxa sp.]|nr:catalase HPII [Enhygromyxa sp.]